MATRHGPQTPLSFKHDLLHSTPLDPIDSCTGPTGQCPQHTPVVHHTVYVQPIRLQTPQWLPVTYGSLWIKAKGYIVLVGLAGLSEASCRCLVVLLYISKY